jgi:uncharacterized protein involved in exopolysaccharide biosynthesis
LTQSHIGRPVAENIELPTLGRALWRAKGWIFGLAIGAGVLTFIVLSVMRPLYTSEARILIQNDESAFTRPANEQGSDPQQRIPDEQAVQSQVQVLTSRDLAVEVIKGLDLTNNPDFAKDAGTSVVTRFLKILGIGKGWAKSEEEKAANAFAENLSVFQLAKSSVIGVDYTSGDAGLAAEVANKLADVYINWQREAKLEQTKDATAWLSAQIEVLRAKVREAETAVEQLRASQGLYAGANNVTLEALEREAKAQRDLLESYLARYRDGSTRHDVGAVPAQAAIVSRAHTSILPSFPKPGRISLLVAATTALLALAYILTRELIGAPAKARETLRAAEPRAAPREERRERRLAAKTMPAGENKAEANAPVGTQSAAGFLERLRRGLAPDSGEPQTAPVPQGGWLGSLRRAQPEEESPAAPKRAGPLPIGGNMPVLRTNDLRAYLNQRLAASAAAAANDTVRKDEASAAKPGGDKVGPVLKSLDAVLSHVLASGQGSAPRALLVGAASPKFDATAEAIAIARALVARRERVVLVDLARGAASVSGALGLPRTPGLTDLFTGRAGFEAVVKLDGDTALQVIPAGNPKLAGSDDENGRFARVFHALTQAYDSVVFHADREALRKLTPGLRFELPIVVAVLPAGADASGAMTDFSKTDFSAFAALGCPVLVYEQNGKAPRSRLLGRAAAV